MTSSLKNPLTTLLALSAEEGSVASRFGGAISNMNSLRERTTNALARTRRRLHEHEAGRSRRLSTRTDEAKIFYDRLEKRIEDTRGRRLGVSEGAVRSVLPELPETHALSWMHEPEPEPQPQPQPQPQP